MSITQAHQDFIKTEDDARWCISHLKRFCEIADYHQQKVVVTIIDERREIHTEKDLEEVAKRIRELQKMLAVGSNGFKVETDFVF